VCKLEHAELPTSAWFLHSVRVVMRHPSSPLPTSGAPPDRCARSRFWLLPCAIAVLHALQNHDADYTPEVELLMSRLESLESAAFHSGNAGLACCGTYRLGSVLALGLRYLRLPTVTAAVGWLLALLSCLLGRDAELLPRSASPGTNIIHLQNLLHRHEESPKLPWHVGTARKWYTCCAM